MLGGPPGLALERKEEKRNNILYYLGMTLEIVLLVAGLIIGGLVAWVMKRPASATDQYLQQLHQSLAERIDAATKHMDTRLRENAHAINESKSFLADRVSSSEKTAREVSTKLGELGQATAALHKTNEEISTFQQMLSHPKVRGSFGEVLLANLLSDVLPSDRYKLQFTFRTSGDIADAIIKLQDGYIVAIDAKFPLANYETYIHEPDEQAKLRARKEFLRDIKKHIKDISNKYISPEEKTLDYAFMYIPIEGVYYETMVHQSTAKTSDNATTPPELWEFSLQSKVVPVSPNSFLAYLQTVLIGLRGMKIQEQAKEILESLGQVRHDFASFAKDYSMIGTHLTNAKNRYDDSARSLDKFSNRMDQIETGTEASTLSSGARQPDDET